MARWRMVTTYSAAALILLLSSCTAVEQTPLILIYTPDAPGYGHELETLLREDGRMNAEILVLESSELFKVAMHLPNVKVAVVAPSLSMDRGIGDTLEWFFSQGGGLVGMGFAGAEQTMGNASEKVFPLFGNAVRTSKYDPKTKSFMMSLVKEEDDEISSGISDFKISTQKLVLSFNGTGNAYLPRRPETGEYKVLFREESMGAPAAVKYEDKGASVTFACFGGDDLERGVNYYGRFSKTKEFRTIFSNSVYWAWTNEKKYDESMSEAEGFYSEESQKIQEARRSGQELERKERGERELRLILTVMVAGLGVVVVYWGTFVRSGRDGT